RGPSGDGEQTSLSIRLSGTVEARLNDQALTLSGKQTRVLLAVLALSAGRAVPVDRIASALWGVVLSGNVRSSGYNYVARHSGDGDQPICSIRLSATVEARRNDQALTLSGKQTRVLLAVLALSAGRAVPVDRIASALWGEELPANVRASVHTYVGRLRRAVGA